MWKKINSGYSRNDNDNDIKMRRFGIISIILGAILVLYFLWFNYYGIIYHEIYSFVYDKFYEGRLDEYSGLYSIDDIHRGVFLSAGNSLAFTNLSSDSVGNEYNEYTEEMYLYVPRLGKKVRLYDSTDKSFLGKGVGMYDISDIPTDNMDEDVNLLIAGHRDGAKANFYNMHRMESGDLIYVYMNGFCYTYEYEETKIVDENDWSVTSRRGYSCITLTSCHPVGKNDQRIVVFGKLIKIQEFTPD